MVWDQLHSTVCVCPLTMRPEVRATTLEMAYSMARACLWRLMCLSTTPCTRAPNRKLTWPMRTMLRPIFIRALVSSKDPQHTPEQGRKEEKQVNAPVCKNAENFDSKLKAAAILENLMSSMSFMLYRSGTRESGQNHRGDVTCIND